LRGQSGEEEGSVAIAEETVTVGEGVAVKAAPVGAVGGDEEKESAARLVEVSDDAASNAGRIIRKDEQTCGSDEVR
jgi:hypothetical protein